MEIIAGRGRGLRGRFFCCCSGFVGLSLFSCRSIGVAPVRGGTYFLCGCKESRQRKQLHTANSEAGPLAWRGSWCIWNLSPRAFRVSDKAVILPAALHAPKPGSKTIGCFGVSPRCSRWPPLRERTRGFSWQTRPRRTQCGVGADDGFVTCIECARAPIPDAPLPPPSQGARLRISGVKLLSLPTFFAAAKKVGAAPHRENANRPTRKQGKANKSRTTTKKPPAPRKRQQTQNNDTPQSRPTKKSRPAQGPIMSFALPSARENARSPRQSEPRTTRRRHAPQ